MELFSRLPEWPGRNSATGTQGRFVRLLAQRTDPDGRYHAHARVHAGYIV
jgi:hypothetical protein